MVKKSDNPHLVNLARAATAAALQRMLAPHRFPYMIREVYKPFSYRGLKVTSLFFSNVMSRLVGEGIVVRQGNLYSLELSSDSLHDFLANSNRIDDIVRDSLDVYFNELPFLQSSRPSGPTIVSNPTVIDKEEVPVRKWTTSDFQTEIPGMPEYLERSREVLQNAMVDEGSVTSVSDGPETVVKIRVISSLDPAWKSVVTTRVRQVGDYKNIDVQWKHGRCQIPEGIHNRYVVWKDGHQVFLIRGPKDGKIVHYGRVQDSYEELLRDDIERMMASLSSHVSNLVTRSLGEAGDTTSIVSHDPVPSVQESTTVIDPAPTPAPVTPEPTGADIGFTQMWMKALTPEQVRRVEQAQKAVLTLMDGQTLSRKDVFHGVITEEWQERFCVKLESAGLLKRTGVRFQTRWTGIPERLEALSSAEQFVPLVLNPVEMADYDAKLYRLKLSEADGHGIDDGGDAVIDEGTGDVESGVEDEPSGAPPLRLRPELDQPLVNEFEARVSALEAAVVQQDKSLRMAADMIMTLISENKRLSEVVSRLTGGVQ